MAKVILLAGHSVKNDGTGTGAKGYIDEAVEAVNLRDTLACMLRQRGVKVETESNTAGLRSVLSWFKSKVMPGDIVIDIHFNAASSDRAKGCEVFIPNAPKDVEVLLASLLAEDIYQSTGVLKRKGRMYYTGYNSQTYEGVKFEDESQHDTLAILSGSTKDISVLLEICFVTNEEDTEKYLTAMASLCYAMASTIQTICETK